MRFRTTRKNRSGNRVNLFVRTLGLLSAGVCASLLLGGCHLDMWIQPKVLPQDRSDFFPDGQASRLPVPGTVARGRVQAGDPFYSGVGADGKTYIRDIPAEALAKFGDRKQMLLRGQERFNIYCTPCHGRSGDGKGMIAGRGLALKRQPANYHTDRLRNIPDGYIFDVITNGVGVMYSYASRLPEPEDRWAVIAYVRALQLSQRANPGAMAAEDRAPLPSTPVPEAGAQMPQGEAVR